MGPKNPSGSQRPAKIVYPVAGEQLDGGSDSVAFCF